MLSGSNDLIKIPITISNSLNLKLEMILLWLKNHKMFFKNNMVLKEKIPKKVARFFLQLSFYK